MRILAVSKNNSRGISKPCVESINLLVGLGVEGDVHAGETVRHRSRMRKDPTQPNLRQVHLIHRELLDELKVKGFELKPGDMGENITTADIPLLDLVTGCKLHLGNNAVVEITGLRNPCQQLNDLMPGLMDAVIEKRPEGLVRKAGVMGVVKIGGEVRPGDSIEVTWPEKPWVALKRV